ncbi:MAG: hypothetical protein JXR77_01240 [Lentisphaeria bacterium]|nr:hypothetical protein [Lentisphaeria bacterium]
MANENGIAAGDRFSCEACGRESIAKLTRVMDGWTYVGDRLACALCGAPVAAAEGASPAAPAPPSSRQAVDRLAALLDTRPEARGSLGPVEKGRFCRDCVHFLRHPFVSRCLLRDKPVEPMQDCDDFQRRPEAKPQDGPPDPPGKDAESR